MKLGCKLKGSACRDGFGGGKKSLGQQGRSAADREAAAFRYEGWQCVARPAQRRACYPEQRRAPALLCALPSPAPTADRLTPRRLSLLAEVLAGLPTSPMGDCGGAW